jgi:hypothetical protein
MNRSVVEASANSIDGEGRMEGQLVGHQYRLFHPKRPRLVGFAGRKSRSCDASGGAEGSNRPGLGRRVSLPGASGGRPVCVRVGVGCIDNG